MEKQIFIDERKIAGMGWRTLAFLADSILLVMIVTAFAAFVYGDELVRLGEEYQKIQETAVGNMLAGTEQSFSEMQTLIEDKINVAEVNSIFNTVSIFAEIAAFAYFFIGEFFFAGTSVGKRIVRIRTVSVNGEKLGAMQCVLRALWKTFTFAPVGIIILIVVVINAYVPFFNKFRRGWHDKTAGTLVVND